MAERGHVITLPEDLSKRILGACYVARISDPSRLIGEMLDLDMEMRSDNISMKKRKNIATFLKAARKKGWKSSGEPSILNAMTRSHNCGLLDLHRSLVLKLAQLVEAMSDSGVRIEKMGRRLARWNELIDLYQAYRLGQVSENEIEERLSS